MSSVVHGFHFVVHASPRRCLDMKVVWHRKLPFVTVESRPSHVWLLGVCLNGAEHFGIRLEVGRVLAHVELTFIDALALRFASAGYERLEAFHTIFKAV